MEGDIKNLNTLCSGIESEYLLLDLSRCKGIERLSNLFRNAKRLKVVTICGLDTTKVRDISYMYNGCESLVVTGIEGKKFNNIDCIEGIYNGCEMLRSIDMSNIKLKGADSLRK